MGGRTIFIILCLSVRFHTLQLYFHSKCNVQKNYDLLYKLIAFFFSLYLRFFVVLVLTNVLVENCFRWTHYESYFYLEICWSARMLLDGYFFSSIYYSIARIALFSTIYLRAQ